VVSDASEQAQEAQAGECWSLKSAGAGPDLALAVVLLAKAGRGWHAAPLFAESGLATDTDRQLTPAPAWLHGETWCALSATVRIAPSALYRRLGVLEPALLKALADARAGADCDLRTGRGLVPGLGDPRERFHAGLGEQMAAYQPSAVREATRPAKAARRFSVRLRAAKASLPGGGARPRPWGWRITAVAAAALVVFGLLLRSRLARLGLEPGAQAAFRVARVEGAVYVRAGERLSRAFVGQSVGADDGVSTRGAQSFALIEDAGWATVELRGDTSVDRVWLRGQERVVSFRRGEIFVDVRERRAGRSFTCITPQAEVRVLGTQFTVALEAGQQTRVAVHRGRVLVIHRVSGRQETLAQGQVAMVGRQLAVAREAIDMTLAGRAARGLQALYLFREGGARRTADMSGVSPALDLRLSGRDCVWAPGGGLQFVGAYHESIAESSRDTTKLYQSCVASDELTVELFVQPSAEFSGLTNGGRIATLSHPAGRPQNRRNWAVHHKEDGAIQFRLITSTAEKVYLDTKPSVLADPTRRYHVCCTYAPGQGMRIYVDGSLKASNAENGTLDADGPNPWGKGYILGLGNRTGTRDRSWLGRLFLTAVYSAALTPGEVRQNCTHAERSLTHLAQGTR